MNEELQELLAKAMVVFGNQIELLEHSKPTTLVSDITTICHDNYVPLWQQIAKLGIDTAYLYEVKDAFKQVNMSCVTTPEVVKERLLDCLSDIGQAILEYEPSENVAWEKDGF